MTRLAAPSSAPRAIDLFSGAGGLTLGLKWAGFRVIGGIELSALAAETYRVNHPDVVLWEDDIRRVPVDAVRQRLKIDVGELDLLAACPPCQGFSSIRTRRRGTRVDERNDLIFEIVRFVDGLRPRAVMMENVPGLAADARLAVLANRLRRRGYRVSWEVLDAADYGVPQRRRRLLLLATRHQRLRPVPSAGVRRTVGDALRLMPAPGTSGDPLHDMTEHRSDHVLEIIRHIPRDGGSRSALDSRLSLSCHLRARGFFDVYGRMAWSSVAPTITGGCVNPSKGRFLHPEQDRAITLREAALLQSFPASYEFSLRRGKYAAAELIGNALPPVFVREQAAVVYRYLMNV
ncbi:MAG: DNA cytosine methyltransferase [Chloroflexota bacterium]